MFPYFTIGYHWLYLYSVSKCTGLELVTQFPVDRVRTHVTFFPLPAPDEFASFFYLQTIDIVVKKECMCPRLQSNTVKNILVNSWQG